MSRAQGDAVAAAERWFVRHGLPYFVNGESRAVRRGLRPSRLGPVLALVALGALGVGAVVGWLAGDVSLGVSSAMMSFGLGVGVYAATTLRAWAIARWAVLRTLKTLRSLFPLVTRALPLLLIFVTFLFINAEVWQVSAALDGGVLWATVMLFVGFAVVFLLARLPEQLDQVDVDVDAQDLIVRCAGTPLEAAARRLAAENRQVHLDAHVTGLQKANLILVLLIAQLVQVLLLSLAVLAFFLAFGAVAMDEGVVESWIGDAAPVTYPFGGSLVSLELLQVSIFLAAFSALYFTVSALTDEVYRQEFFTSVLRELERALAARTVYQVLTKDGGSG